MVLCLSREVRNYVILWLGAGSSEGIQ